MTLTTRPVAIPLPEAAAFPPDLLTLRHWVAFALEERDGGLTKVPYNPHTGYRAKSNDASTWGTFAEAAAHARPRGMGVGFMLAPPLFGFDLDHCITDGVISPLATSVLGELHTYAEPSVSGTGIKGIGYGKKPGTRCRRKGLDLEIYDHARLFALTGQLLDGAPLAINDCQDGLDFIYGAVFGEESPPPPPRAPLPVTDEDDAAVVDWLHEHCPGTFPPLWHGAVGDDHSAADLGLCNLLAWRIGDERRVDQLFRQSALYRPKWDERRGERTYGERTVAAAFKGRASFYSAPPVFAFSGPAPDAAPSAVAEATAAPPDPALIEYLSMSHEELARRAYRAERFNKAYIRFDKNKHVKTQKPTIRAVLFEYDNLSRAGRVDAEGWAPSSLAALGEGGGGSKDAAGDHLKEIAAWGVGIEKDVRDEEYRVPVANGGEIVQKRPRLYIKVDGDVVDKLEELAVFAPPKREGKNSWGGKRDSCGACGSHNTHRETRVVCDECGHIGQPLVETPPPIVPPGPAPTYVVDEAGNIPPAPVAVPLPPATYPPGQPVYVAEEASEEQDDWDERECNHPGCVRPIVIGLHYCGLHRHLGLTLDPPPVRPPVVAPTPAPASLDPAIMADAARRHDAAAIAGRLSRLLCRWEGGERGEILRRTIADWRAIAALRAGLDAAALAPSDGAR